MQLRNKKVLLTGASGGIGNALAVALIAQGATLVLAGRNPIKLQDMARRFSGEQNTVLAVMLELGSAHAIEQANNIARQHPDIDILVNCAGSNLFSACTTTSAQQTVALLNVNLTGTILLTQALLPNLLARPEAMIVNIGSTFGSIGYPGFTVYCASKFGLRGYTEALRRELTNTPVKVVYVAPRATATDMNEANVIEMNKALGNAMDSPQHVAACVLQAMKQERARMSIGWPEKLFVVLNGLFTRLVDNALKKQLPVIQRFLSREAPL